MKERRERNFRILEFRENKFDIIGDIHGCYDELMELIQKLGYETYRELLPGEIVKITADRVETLSEGGSQMRICSFLWTYYGYPNSVYEGVTVETMRTRNGEIMAEHDMKNGTIIRQVVNKLNEIDFNASEDRHTFGDIYESLLRDLQSAGNYGEFYTPRAVTEIMTEIINPRLGEKVLDPACGTGGFLTSAIENIRKQIKDVSIRRTE